MAQHKGLCGKIREWWEPFVFIGKPDYILGCKLKTLKGKLKEWSRTNLGNLGLQRVQILSQLAMLDAVMENRVLTEEESAMKASLIMDYEQHLRRDSMNTKIKSFVAESGGQKYEVFSQSGQCTQKMQ